MKEFDFRRAWQEAAKPAFDSLPQPVMQLYQIIQETYGEERQQSDLGMRFLTPELRAAFEAIDTETLAHAARAVYFYGHWGSENESGPHGATWKFSTLADEVLSARLGLPRPHKQSGTGWSRRVMQGALRLCYSSTPRRGGGEFWTWEELGYASEHANELAATASAPAGNKADYDAVKAVMERIAGQLIRELRLAGHDPLALLLNTERYMVEADQATRAPDDLAKQRERLIQQADKKTAEIQTETAGMVWLLDHGISVDNCIYYSHERKFMFGWRDHVSDAFRSQVLDVIAEFPYEYGFKTPRA